MENELGDNRFNTEDLDKTIVLDETTERPTIKVSDRCQVCDDAEEAAESEAESEDESSE